MSNTSMVALVNAQMEVIEDQMHGPHIYQLSKPPNSIILPVNWHVQRIQDVWRLITLINVYCGLPQQILYLLLQIHLRFGQNGQKHVETPAKRITVEKDETAAA